MRKQFKKLTIKDFNIADWISLYRFFASLILLLFVFLNQEFIFIILLIISFFSDALDGFIARKLKITSKRGAFLDSFADMTTYIVAFIGIIWFKTDFLIEQIFLFSIVVGLYLIQLGLAYWRYGKPSSFHTYSVKIATIFQVAFILTLFIFDVYYWLFYIAIVLSIIEALEEITLIFILPKWETDVKGIYWVVKRKKYSLKN